MSDQHPPVAGAICSECPFRRDSLPGYLGAASRDPEGFINPHYEGGHHLPCHCQVDWEAEDSQEQAATAPACRGLLTLMKNSCKLPFPNSPQRAVIDEVEPDAETVFKWKHEFIEHHEH